MHNFVYFVNLSMFGRIYAHHQEVQPYVYNNWYLLFSLDDCLLSNQDNRQSSKENNKYQLLYTYGCTS